MFIHVFELHMTSSLWNKTPCHILNECIIIIVNVLWETRSVNRLYPVQPFSLPPKLLKASKPTTKIIKEYIHWHGVVGDISSDRYQALLNIVPDFPEFSTPVVDNHHWFHFMTGNCLKHLFEVSITESPTNQRFVTIFTVFYRNYEQEHICATAPSWLNVIFGSSCYSIKEWMIQDSPQLGKKIQQNIYQTNRDRPIHACKRLSWKHGERTSQTMF